MDRERGRAVDSDAEVLVATMERGERGNAGDGE